MRGSRADGFPVEDRDGGLPEKRTLRLEAATAAYDGTATDTFLRTLLSRVGPGRLIFGLWIFLFRRLAQKQRVGGMRTVGKSKARVHDVTDMGVTFDDVAGIDEGRAELQEIARFLKKPERCSRPRGGVPKGIRPAGPPGTGKTPAARTVAGEAGGPSSRSAGPNAWRCSWALTTA